MQAWNSAVEERIIPQRNKGVSHQQEGGWQLSASQLNKQV